MTLIEKQLFRINSAKIVAYQTLDRLLGVDFADLDCVLKSSGLLVKVNLFRNLKRQLRESATVKLKELFMIFCPSLAINLEFYKVIDEKSYPKYYYLLFYQKYFRYKTNPFSIINKLDNISLSSKVSGLFIRVRGKRGLRKDQKVFITGDVSKHSCDKNKLKKYKGILETPMGTLGITVSLMFK